MRKKVLIMLAVLVLLLTSSLSAQAGDNGTNVFVNGYELTQTELIQLQYLLGYSYIPPGNYWLDSNGNFGVVNNYTYNQAYGSGVYVNDYELSPQQLQAFEYYFGPLQRGYYWWDGEDYLAPITDPWIEDAGGAYISGDGQGCVGFVWSDVTYLSDDC